MLWKDALYDYKMYLKLEKRVSDNTIENYLRDLDKLIKYSDKLPLDYQQDDGEVVILKVENVDTDEESYVSVDNEETLNKVFEIFKEKFKDEFNFTDDE